jgi:hypothetical protein
LSLAATFATLKITSRKSANAHIKYKSPTIKTASASVVYFAPPFGQFSTPCFFAASRACGISCEGYSYSNSDRTPCVSRNHLRFVLPNPACHCTRCASTALWYQRLKARREISVLSLQKAPCVWDFRTPFYPFTSSEIGKGAGHKPGRMDVARGGQYFSCIVPPGSTLARQRTHHRSQVGGEVRWYFRVIDGVLSAT